MKRKVNFTSKFDKENWFKEIQDIYNQAEPDFEANPVKEKITFTTPQEKEITDFTNTLADDIETKLTDKVKNIKVGKFIIKIKAIKYECNKEIYSISILEFINDMPRRIDPSIDKRFKDAEWKDLFQNITKTIFNIDKKLLVEIIRWLQLMTKWIVMF